MSSHAVHGSAGRWHVLVEVGSAAAAVELARHLGHVNGGAVECSGEEVLVVLPDVVTARDGLVEISFYLSMWRGSPTEIRAIALVHGSHRRRPSR